MQELGHGSSWPLMAAMPRVVQYDSEQFIFPSPSRGRKNTW
ncbi:hypothetical protein [Marivirga sp.]|nr:hypothetical protein [Marivirga sp.]